VYNAPFFILLNLAIGGPGTFLGTPNPNAPFPNQDLVFDYVRVYQAVSTTAATPVITPGRVVNAASYLGTLAPGALAVLYGANLADNIYQDVSDASGNFVKTVGNVSVTVGGTAAALVYVSPTQINFQVPWEVTAPGLTVPVQVTRSGVASNVENITISANASPSMFLEDFTNGIAWITGAGCVTTECVPQAGGVYQLWVNGLGPKNAAEQDGVPVVYSGSLTPLEVPGGSASCQLTIGGQTATVDYCGAAPFEIIDQVNFKYPAGVTSTTSYVDATLTVNGATGRFRVPAPGQ
ncbi:MAG TPA: IPT/TIG domain-containing protein, partial [Bryobacteraceae bacterium]|nr:IPT/TIG domain-containing protein [Bryobacteraceae bacterium]